jgi:hypothetical protein
MKVRALASAIGIVPVIVAGILLMLCNQQRQAWALLGATTLMYAIWIRAGKS